MEAERPLSDRIDATSRWDAVIDDSSQQAPVQLLRTVQQHHVQLSAMADFKASILITATSIIVTAFAALTSSIGLEAGIVAATPFVLTSLGFAIYTVIPKGSTDTKAGPGSPSFNLLFFAHFEKLEQQEYIDEMMEIIATPSQIYAHQIKDIYQLGKYLGESKYRYLRYAYATLFFGIVIGAVIQLGTVAF